MKLPTSLGSATLHHTPNHNPLTLIPHRGTLCTTPEEYYRMHADGSIRTYKWLVLFHNFDHPRHVTIRCNSISYGMETSRTIFGS
ncbi:Uncharacterized protein FKW44_003305 [Caligus rogercresseyi]|uniref:Uncharacterized protein n=1 Tax=Caligus rogercresseyi TaxID=217165 RepID=A0A7T8KLE1_CALRO|nr:Uncharacterized protein FKW44_003305 [Caligus rogercresseyi]